MPSLNPIQQLNVGEALGGASGAGIVKTDANGLVLDPATAATADIANGAVTLAKLADLANATVIGRNTSGTSVPEAVTMAQLAVLLQGQGFRFSVLQTFAASLGLLLTPGVDPGAPAAGQVWYDSALDALSWRTSSGKTRRLIESGTFTASVRPDTLGDWAPTYTAQLGFYLKVGPIMVVGFDVAGTTNAYTTGTGTIGISDLPYTVYNSTAFNGFGGFTNITGLDTQSSSHDGWMPYGRANTTRIAFTRQAKAANPGGSASASVTQLPASRAFILRGMALVITNDL